MEYILIIILSLICLILMSFVCSFRISKIKELKKIGFSEDLKKISDKFPENKDVCEEMLKKINNYGEVKVVEDKNARASLYIVVTNTISIANIKKSFTRIQTIAHECIHSTQDKKMLMFNFIYSNLYLLYFVCISVLTLFNKIPNPMLQVVTLIMLSFVYYKVRSYLETDAMTRAPYVAEEYMRSTSYVSDDEIDVIVQNNNKVNEIGIKFANLKLFTNCIVKIIIYCVICLI